MPYVVHALCLARQLRYCCLHFEARKQPESFLDFMTWSLSRKPLEKRYSVGFFFLEQKFLFTIVVLVVVSEVMVLLVVCLLFI